MPGVVHFLLEWVVPGVLTFGFFWLSNRWAYQRGFMNGQIQEAQACLKAITGAYHAMKAMQATQQQPKEREN